MAIEVKSVYRYIRKNRKSTTAVDALELARHYAKKGEYPRLYGPVSYNPDNNGVRFVENIENGLRFCGFADEVSSRVGHKGWFLTVDGVSGEVARGIVAQLPARDRGTPLYVPGYMAHDDGGSVVNFSDWYEEAEEAATVADGMAEAIAESEREWDAGWIEGGHYEDAKEAAVDARKEALPLFKALKEEATDSVLKAAAYNRLSDLIDTWRDAKNEMLQAVGRCWSDDMRAGFSDRTGFKF